MNTTYASLPCIGGTVRVDSNLIFYCKASPLYKRLNELNVYPLKNRDDFPAVFFSDVTLQTATNPKAEPPEDFDDESRYESDLLLRSFNRIETRTLLIRSVSEAVVDGLPTAVVISWTGEAAAYKGTWKALKLKTT